MITASALATPGAGWTDVMGASACLDMGPMHAVWLIDRRTGSAHRVNGEPQVIHTQRPDVASATLLKGRDPSVWKTVSYPLGQSVEP